jgi:hypothetical protein
MFNYRTGLILKKIDEMNEKPVVIRFLLQKNNCAKLLWNHFFIINVFCVSLRT